VSAPAAAGVVAQEPSATRNWEKFGNALVLLAYSAVVLFTVRYHEKWADEAQAWLIARDLDLKTIWFHELRYEGHPGLWHTILWVAQRGFHASYDSMSYIGVAFAIAGVAVLVYKAPFPWFVRWPLAFTYVMVYQYAVIARPYTLLPLLCFLAAIYFKDFQHPERLTVILLVMSYLTLHGTIIAGCIGLAYLLDASKKWKNLNTSTRDRYWACIGIMFIAVLLLFLILRPTADVRQFAPKDPRLNNFPQPTVMQKLLSMVCGAFLDRPLPSILFLALTGAWCFIRRRLMIFALPAILLTALYMFIQGYSHHHGTIFVSTITALWIAWPTRKEIGSLTLGQTWATRGMIGLLLCLCALNIWDAAVVIKRDYIYPYSGAMDAAKYLKSVGADHGTTFGYLYGVVGIQPYFSKNIFANMPTSYFHHGVGFRGGEFYPELIESLRPEYIVAYSTDPQLMLETDGPMWSSLGYEFAHFSDGYSLYKRVIFQRESYLIFRRVHPTGEQTPPTSSPDK
jgi:hypothetical protein